MTFPQVNGFEISEKIGSGSYSNVYKAYKKLKPNEVYAIKCIDKQYHKKSFANNVIKEISLLKQLKHKNIMHMEDFLWNTKHIFIVMEFCDGGDLSHLIRRRHKLKESVVRKIMQQLSQALQFLQKNNVCHMDLKPQNLLLMWKPELVLKVADFGLSQYLTGETEQCRFIGSPLYMAPEKLLNQKFDARVDLWSTGIIMFECLFGRPPYTNLNSHTLNLMSKQIPIELPKNIEMSSVCRDLLLNLLKHNPNERINFENFFLHPFLHQDEKYDAYQKAHSLIQEAIKLDHKELYSESIPRYEKAITLIESVINDGELDEVTILLIKSRVQEYTSWVRILKTNLQCSKMSPSSEYKLVLCPKEDFEKIRTLASTTPYLANALEIGRIGELYLAEGQTSQALDKLKTALSIMVPSLQTEPSGERRNLLHSQTQRWMQLAETVSRASNSNAIPFALKE